MICLACRHWAPVGLCVDCERSLAPGADRSASFGVVRSAFDHSGAARILVHRLKYEGVVGAADLIVDRGLSSLVPEWATALVPVPRVVWRRARYGVDPALVLATALSRRCGVPLLRALGPALIGSPHAGRSRHRRSAPMQRLVARCPDGVVLVDDVVTTGSTLESSAATIGPQVRMAITGTASL